MIVKKIKSDELIHKIVEDFLNKELKDYSFRIKIKRLDYIYYKKKEQGK